MNKKHVSITLGIMCFVLTFGIMVQLNTIKTAVDTVGKSIKETSLKDEVLKTKENYDKVYNDLENSEKQLEKERQASTSTDSISIEKQKKLKELNTYLGLTDVTGEGVIITLQDNTSSKVGLSYDLVHDVDLRLIINEAKNVGVDAISINGQRIVPTTSITCAGTVIQVNNESIGSPFTIKIIGDKAALYNSLMRPGSYLKILKDDYGLSVDIKKSEEISIKRYNGILTDKYIENAE